MQFSVSDRAAVAFPQGFYTALAAGRPVDEAVRAGRVAILGIPHSLEWVTPVLYLRGDAASLFTVPAPEITTPKASEHPEAQHRAAPTGVPDGVRPDDEQGRENAEPEEPRQGRMPNAPEDQASRSKPALRPGEIHLVHHAVSVAWDHGDASRILAALDEDEDSLRGDLQGTVRVVDNTGQAVLSVRAGSLLRPRPTAAVTLSPDGRRVAAGVGLDEEGKNWVFQDRLLVWDVATGDCLLDERQPSTPHNLAWEPYGQYLATLSGDSALRIWDVASKAAVCEIPDAGWRYSLVALDADGRHVLTEGRGEIRVWDVATGQLNSRQPTERVRAVTSDLTRGATTTDTSGTVRRWGRDHPVEGELTLHVVDVPDGTEVSSWVAGRIRPASGLELRFSPDGYLLAAVWENGGGVWDAKTGHRLIPLPGMFCVQLAFSADGSRLAALGLGGLVSIHALPEKPT
jgi:hypothetical protein